MSLQGKCAVVTGSTSGIGLGIAQALARAGASVVLNGFGDAAEIETIRTRIETDHGVKAVYIAADLMTPEGCRDLMDKAAGAFGHVDVLVNNAGIQHTAPIADFPEDRWAAVIALNLSAVFHCTKAALPGMTQAGWGRVINIASAHGLVASPQKAAYVAAKHGVVGLTKVTALETANTGVTCNAICPGWVLTPLVQRQVDAIAADRGLDNDGATRVLLEEKQPLLEFTTPESLGEFAVFLCSDAARTMTGASLGMDSGWTAR